MDTSRLIKRHRNHKITLLEGPFIFDYKKNNGHVEHQSKLMCRTCNIMLRWMNKNQTNLYKSITKKNMTYNEFLNELTK